MEAITVVGNVRLPDGTSVKATLSPARRQMMIAVMDGFEKDLSGTMQILHCHRHCEAFLRFLLVNRYTGKNLVDFLTGRFQGNVYKMVEYIVDHSKSRYCDASR